MSENLLKNIPSVSEILSELPDTISLHDNVKTRLINEYLDRVRKKILSGKENLTRDEIKAQVIQYVSDFGKPNFKNVINGTGIVLHTGLGRAPIGFNILERISQRLAGYVNLEFDLNSGKRGNRLDHLDFILSAMTGAEKAMVVNNNASAVLLALNTLAEGKEVVVSRGQQVEIGGSFRIPDIIRKSNCLLKEIGTTNRTHLYDYEQAINSQTGMLLWVHTSNYRVEGFTGEVQLSDMVKIGKSRNIPVMADLGSGALINLEKINLPAEKTVAEIVSTGVDIVTFSGDKLLGGPQSGLIVGSGEYINRLRKNILYRALRCDKFTLSILEELLRTYSTEAVSPDNLAVALLSKKPADLKIEGEEILSLLKKDTIEKLGISLVESDVEAGSGSLPVNRIESMALSFLPKDLKITQVARSFRQGNPPVVGYINNERYFIDLKAILPNQISLLATAIEAIIN